MEDWLKVIVYAGTAFMYIGIAAVFIIIVKITNAMLDAAWGLITGWIG